MVRIYTKTGDDGTTGLLYGGRVPKDSLVMQINGAVDEAQASMGMARALPPRSTNAKIGVLSGASTKGGAILASYAFKHGFSLPLRFEYISSSSSVAKDTINLMYGPGSAGTSFTATPTFQTGGFFVRGDIAWAHASSFEKGYVFGPLGLNDNQFRAVAEIGFVFGNNIEKKP